MGKGLGEGTFLAEAMSPKSLRQSMAEVVKKVNCNRQNNSAIGFSLKSETCT